MGSRCGSVAGYRARSAINGNITKEERGFCLVLGQLFFFFLFESTERTLVRFSVVLLNFFLGG